MFPLLPILLSWIQVLLFPLLLITAGDLQANVLGWVRRGDVGNRVTVPRVTIQRAGLATCCDHIKMDGIC